MAIAHHHLTADQSQVGRIDRVVQILTQKSRADIRGLFDHDCVSLNGMICAEPGALIAAGDQVEVRFDPHTRYKPKLRPPQDRAYRLVFEDEHLIVVDKSAIVLTVPTDRGESNTLVDALARYLAYQRRQPKPCVIHRLDRGTSGLLVFGKNPRIAQQIQDQFRDRKPEREYHAIVAGQLANTSGTFDSHLGTGANLTRYSTTQDDDQSEHAITHYVVERPLHRATYVRVNLETGRRNQIRVHFAEAGHPVLGDERYAPKLARHHAWSANRLALHAGILGFEHPITQLPLRFESPLPEEFSRFMKEAELWPKK